MKNFEVAVVLKPGHGRTFDACWIKTNATSAKQAKSMVSMSGAYLKVGQAREIK